MCCNELLCDGFFWDREDDVVLFVVYLIGDDFIVV